MVVKADLLAVGFLIGMVVGAVGTGEIAFEEYVLAAFALDFLDGFSAFAHQAVAVLLIDKSL